MKIKEKQLSESRFKQLLLRLTPHPDSSLENLVLLAHCGIYYLDVALGGDSYKELDNNSFIKYGETLISIVLTTEQCAALDGYFTDEYCRQERLIEAAQGEHTEFNYNIYVACDPTKSYE
jgi:hypothetical protein